VFRLLGKAWPALDAPVKLMPDHDPFRILVSAVLSTRTRDSTTARASARLFARAHDPGSLTRLAPAAIDKLIYPVGFHNTKSRLLPALAQMLVDRWKGRVPATLEDLTGLPGVGRKVANIVLSRGFGLPAIAVDTHVHRISNRLGLVATRDPFKTELALMELLPKRFWRDWNQRLVALGQTVCRPARPLCPVCPVRSVCPRRGVKASR
jgi:endonuclease-3